MELPAAPASDSGALPGTPAGSAAVGAQPHLIRGPAAVCGQGGQARWTSEQAPHLCGALRAHCALRMCGAPHRVCSAPPAFRKPSNVVVAGAARSLLMPTHCPSMNRRTCSRGSAGGRRVKGPRAAQRQAERGRRLSKPPPSHVVEGVCYGRGGDLVLRGVARHLHLEGCVASAGEKVSGLAEGWPNRASAPVSATGPQALMRHQRLAQHPPAHQRQAPPLCRPCRRGRPPRETARCRRGAPGAARTRPRAPWGLPEGGWNQQEIV